MKVCPNCQTKYPDDANFCPQETCATPNGPRRLDPIAEQPAGSRYELESQIGGQRSGEVWRARDGQTGAVVAYKRVARASLPTPAALERALRELKQLQRAQSPRLARILDFGRDPEGQLFVVTELADGRPLDQLVAEAGPLPLDRAKKITAQIGEALLEGQKVGVVHHDLSAKNVLVTDGDDVKVINFVAPVAVTETVFGVAEYLSPEQAEGKLVDQRSNTYSLGAILTLMLAGRSPVTGPDVPAILATVQRGEIVPPSRIAPGLTPEVDRVVLKAMDKSPNRRPLTLRQFLTDVGGLVSAGAPTLDRAGVGFAKTMMFTGGAPEVQKLVNQALAARAEAGVNGAQAGAAPHATPPAAPTNSVGRGDAGAATPPPRVAPPAQAAATPPPQAAATPPPQPVTPPPVVGAPPLGPRRSHGAAIAATMVAMPAANVRLPGQAPAAAPSADLDGSMAATPPPQPIASTPPPTDTGAGTAPTPKPAAGGTFRETLWFKKGDVEQMVADARARVEAARSNKAPVAAEEAEAPAPPEEDARPLEDRYVDDGSVTAEDRKKFSLRSGGTSTALPSQGSMPGERMSDTEMVKEIGGGKRIAIIVVTVIVVLGIGVTVLLGFRHKGGEAGPAAQAPAPTPPVAAEPPAPPPPVPTPAAPAPKAAAEPAPKAAAAAKEKEEDDEAAPAAAAPAPKAHSSSKKHTASKKGKSGKKHR
jgi:serine/threonine-protein kinase